MTGCDAQLTVQPLYRPGAAEVSFGAQYGDEEESGESLLEEESHEWTDVLGGDWRKVSM